jgi:26S proteasome regulatory subunit N6
MDVETTTAAGEAAGMDIVDENEVDAFVEEFEGIDESEKNTSVFEKMLVNERTDDAAVKIKEKCMYKLGRLHTENKDMNAIISLMRKNGDFFAVIPKARTAKIVRNILNIVSSIPDSLDIQLKLCEDLVKWCETEKRSFLKQRIESKYCTLLWLKKEPTKALETLDPLLNELKKLDDKQMLTEVHLTESRIYHALENIPKSKASLTAARSAANTIYVVPLLQAELDEQSGILCCEELDNTTAFSYFQEAYDAYDGAKDPRAVTVLKYMSLAKVLNDMPKEVHSLMSSKMGLKHAGVELEALGAIAKAVSARSLEDFEEAVDTHKEQLKTDDLIKHHLDSLYEKMFESNLVKIITPFSSVEIAHVAMLINMPVPRVEKKLSQMILDHKVSGILDQGKGVLEIFEETKEDVSFTNGMTIIANMAEVVDTLMNRGKKFNRGELTDPTDAATAADKDGKKDDAAKKGDGKDKAATDSKKEGSSESKKQ